MRIRFGEGAECLARNRRNVDVCFGTLHLPPREPSDWTIWFTCMRAPCPSFLRVSMTINLGGFSKLVRSIEFLI